MLQSLQTQLDCDEAGSASLVHQYNLNLRIWCAGLRLEQLQMLTNYHKIMAPNRALHRIVSCSVSLSR